MFGSLPSASAQSSDVTSSGTGFFVSADGWIVTNAHVVEGCRRITVLAQGDVTDQKVDAQNDLAAIRIAPTASMVLKLRASEPRLGEDVAAFGYPLSDVLSSSVKITTGNVNSLLGPGDDSRYLQISTPIQPGNSGGPLVDRGGLVLGITSARLKATAGGDNAPQNVNFAVRGSVLRLFLQSRGIPFQAADSAPSATATADLADLVSPSVVQILCHGTPEPEPTANTAAAASPPDARQLAIDFATRLETAWSEPNAHALIFMETAYSEQVNFYGKVVPASTVISEKRKFAVRWPIRNYNVRPGTISASCVDNMCTVSSLIDWFARSEERNKSASGVASFELIIDVGRGKIVSESGKVLKGQ
jgi:hypothetical protein